MSATAISSSEDPERLYREREQRLNDAIALREPDRVPAVYHSMFWHATYAGITFKDAMYDHRKLGEAARHAVLDLQPDAVTPPHYVSLFGAAMDIMGFRPLKWPGHGVDENHSYQYLDHEYVKPEEYDDFINDPTWFIMTRFLPRVADVFAPFARFPQFPSMDHLRLVHSMAAFADPELQAAFAQLAQAGREIQRMLQSAAAFEEEIKALGFPLFQFFISAAPYDYFADYLRGSKGIMLDLFRHKDKLLEAMEHVIPMLVDSAVQALRDQPRKIAFLPMHWGLDGFMSLDQFKTFFWPQLRRVMIGMIGAGLIPLVLWEGNCASRLETIADIPRGKAIYWFERTDLKLAKKVLGGIVCLKGNVPVSLLNAGTPDQVRAYCRDLIETVGKGGGFILSGATGVPDEAKPANVLAMFRSVREFRNQP